MITIGVVTVTADVDIDRRFYLDGEMSLEITANRSLS